MQLGLDSKNTCKGCKAARRSAKLAKARAERGLPPLGEAVRRPDCVRCSLPKENKDSGYCNACKRLAAKERRLKLKESPDFAEKERERKRNKYHESEFSKLKVAVHVQTYRAIKSGEIVRMPCEVCVRS